MPYAPLLPENEIEAGLRARPDWQRDDGALVRTVRLASFRDAVTLVNRVADAAEAADHHPDIQISWRTVTFRLTTKASGGLTARDLEMASEIDRLIAA